jgi:outer membrane protein assembly factor BamB
MIFFPSGFSTGQLLAVRPDARGLANDANVAWKLTRAVPQKPSLTLVGDTLFMVNDRGIASAVDAMTGEVIWTSRVRGEYSASPIAAAGRVYLFSEDGRTTVIAAAREFRILAESELGDGFMASPAVDGNAFILRSRSHLYRVEEAAVSTR